ncbi:MAG: D-aminoacylase [Candidatus Glassbacteria bacterium]|nr:D-aminoacylase [Candidatus Glassbacteria bacterium]
MTRFTLLTALTACLALACSSPPRYDIIIRGGTIYDGSGAPGYTGDLAVVDDTIAAVGQLPEGATAGLEIDAAGKAVSPGFVNLMSWANESLIEDGRSKSDIMQGVTLEVTGEGESMGPLTEGMKHEMKARQGDIQYDIEWTSLAGYLQFLEDKGVSCNVGSFIGAATPRIYVIGYEDRPPTDEELERMCELVEEAMREGAMGVASSLIYAPGFYAETDELVALCKAAAKYNGLHTSHLRSESYGLLDALDEFLRVVRESGIRGEVFHLKAAGEDNWPKLAQAIEKIELARAEGLHVTADVYTYTAASTGLNGAMPPWVQEGGHDRWVANLKDPSIRRKVADEMNHRGEDWENFFDLSGSDGCLVVGLQQDSLKPLTGKTLTEIAEMWDVSPAEAAMDLVVKDNSRVQMVYFAMSEDNIRLKLSQPWVGICSDALSAAPEGVFLLSSTHPRAYGSYARFLGRYVRDQQVAPLEQAIHRISGLTCENLGLTDRGLLAPGYFADVVVFDPATIRDNATYEEPMQFATGVEYVLVNGTPVVAAGEHTGATPGRFVRGPGYQP